MKLGESYNRAPVYGIAVDGSGSPYSLGRRARDRADKPLPAVRRPDADTDQLTAARMMSVYLPEELKHDLAGLRAGRRSDAELIREAIAGLVGLGSRHNLKLRTARLRCLAAPGTARWPTSRPTGRCTTTLRFGTRSGHM